MALSTRAKLAGLGGALALGVLGATGIAYAADGTAGPQYVTTVDDGSGYGTAGQAPGTEGQRDADGKDCPEGSGGSGSGGQGDQGGGTESPAPQESSPAPVNPADG